MSDFFMVSRRGSLPTTSSHAKGTVVKKIGNNVDWEVEHHMKSVHYKTADRKLLFAGATARLRTKEKPRQVLT